MKRALAFAGSLLCLATSSRGLAQAPPESDIETVKVRGAARHDGGTANQVVDLDPRDARTQPSVGTSLERWSSFFASGDSRGERILSYRGFDQRRLAVFVDGIPMYVPFDGQADLAKIPAELVSRVHVVSGSGAFLMGPNGLGGALHLVTREAAEAPTLRASTEVAPLRAARTFASYDVRKGPFSLVVGGSLQGVRSVPLSGDFARLPNQDTGDRTNSDYRAASVLGKGTWELTSKERLVLSLFRVQGEYGVPPGTRDLTVRYWRWTDWESTNFGLRHEHMHGPLVLSEAVYLSHFGNLLDAFDDARYQTQRLPKAFHSTYDDLTVGAIVRGRATFALPAGGELAVRTWLGLKRDRHLATADRDAPEVRVASTLGTAAAEVDVALLRHTVRGTVGLQLDGELPEQPPSGSAPDGSAAAGPMGSLSYLLRERVTFTASAARRTRFPTLRERYSTVFGARAANPGLGPEHATNLAFDVAVAPSPSTRLAGGLFYAQLEDLVQSVYIAPRVDQLRNVGVGRNVGFELSGRTTLLRRIDLSLSATVLSQRTGEGLATPVPNAANPRATAMVTVRPFPFLRGSAVVRYRGAQSFLNPDTGVPGRLGGALLVDARIDLDVGRSLRTWLRATNLLDTNVEGRYSFPEPGREIFAGVATDATF